VIAVPATAAARRVELAEGIGIDQIRFFEHHLQPTTPVLAQFADRRRPLTNEAWRE